MAYVQLLPVSKPKHLEMTASRFDSYIRDLEMSGFSNLQTHLDCAPPFHLIKDPGCLFLMVLAKDLWCFRWPLTCANICLLWQNTEYHTYAKVFGLGALFYTAFEDETVFISASWAGDNWTSQDGKINKRYFTEYPACAVQTLENLKSEANQPTPLFQCWIEHTHWIAEHFSVSSPVSTLSFEHFQTLSLLEDTALEARAASLGCAG